VGFLDRTVECKGGTRYSRLIFFSDFACDEGELLKIDSGESALSLPPFSKTFLLEVELGSAGDEGDDGGDMGSISLLLVFLILSLPDDSILLFDFITPLLLLDQPPSL